MLTARGANCYRVAYWLPLLERQKRQAADQGGRHGRGPGSRLPLRPMRPQGRTSEETMEDHDERHQVATNVRRMQMSWKDEASEASEIVCVRSFSARTPLLEAYDL